MTEETKQPTEATEQPTETPESPEQETVEEPTEAAPEPEGEQPSEEVGSRVEIEDAPSAGVNAIDLPDGDEEFSDAMLEQAYDASLANIQEGEVVRGTVLAITDEGVLVDIGYKSEGFIELAEFGRDEEGKPRVHVGDEMDVYLVRLEDQDGLVVLSKEIADQRRIWEDIADAYENGLPVKGQATRRIKGGLRVEIGTMYAFLPASQIDIRPVQDLDAFLNRDLEMRVIKLNRRRRNIVLSRRVLLEEQRESMRDDLLKTLEVGQTRKGVVKNITQFGAFIDLGGLDGLLHKTDMSWGRVGHPSEVVERDQDIEVMVLNINKETGKVSLGLKQLTRDPWEGIGDRYPVTNDVKGRVVNIVEYGAFI
ncbi:MAG: S1 RNA-binding domain-containing protein [Candidatus Poribacteria bacterium]|nr:S1 RNA-binding domain-containing protein [Candidatus Poribacteria bacterium]